MRDQEELKELLDMKVEEYNQPGFIENDPILIPHMFINKQDIEIAGFLAAVLAWGQRKTIINKCKELMKLMDNAPFDFVKNHKEKDLKRFLSFRHRTFNPTDTLYFIHFLKYFYEEHDSLEEGFLSTMTGNSNKVESGLMKFYNLFFSLPDAPNRTRKHIPTPAKKSACKRLNMFLRWMVRNDSKGVDFGIWKNISPAQLISPCDVHVDRVARALGLIKRKSTDWQTALELTSTLKIFDLEDPVKYDFALFGLGLESKIN